MLFAVYVVCDGLLLLYTGRVWNITWGFHEGITVREIGQFGFMEIEYYLRV